MKELIVTALDHELHRPSLPPSPLVDVATEHFAVDTHGWPVLKRTKEDRTVVTDALVAKLRGDEGV